MWVRSWVGAIALTAGLCAAHVASAEDYLTTVKDLRGGYAAELEKLAVWCDGEGLKAEAAKTRGWCGKSDPYTVRVYVLPEEANQADPPADASPAVLEWHKRFWRLRQQQAATLLEIARKCIRGKRASLAYELALRAGREDPDNEAVRRIFGYQKFRGGWYTQYEIKKLRAGHVWDDRFGWLPKANVRRYEEGQRLADGRWISAEEDAKLHANISRGWEIETEHYRIRTNHSLQAGVELCAKLERLYRVWAQMFVSYYSSESALAALFDGRPKPAPEAKKLRIVYFRDHADYVRTLQQDMPNVGMSVGVYVEKTETAYFFAGKEADDRTLYHEATHQLFHQSRPPAQHVGRKANFWIIEGIALYMESLHRDGDSWVLGGQRDMRMLAARVRLLRDNFYIPFADVNALSMEKLQSDPRIATIYSQLAGQTHFLIHYDNGRYRDELVAYLLAVYIGNDDSSALAKLTGESYATLDKQYRSFVEEGAKSVNPRP